MFIFVYLKLIMFGIASAKNTPLMEAQQGCATHQEKNLVRMGDGRRPFIVIEIAPTNTINTP
jgi:hypothetical protein